MATIPAGTKFLGVDPSLTDLTEKKGTRLDNKTEYFSLEDLAATVGVGSEGPQGIQGPAGPPGPVGPAGLNWQGAWDTDSSYAVDDAVGFNGASWFCISEVTGTGNANPEEDTVSWALLAAQGAVGPQGPQGPTGPQGPAGTAGSIVKTKGLVSANSTIPYNLLDYDVNTVTGTANQYVRLPQNATIGKEIIVSSNGINPLNIVAYNNGFTISVNDSNGNTAIYQLYSGDTVKFISQGNDFWTSEYVSGTNITYNGKRLGASFGYVIADSMSNPTTTPYTANELNVNYPNTLYPIGTKVMCPNITGGGLMYIKRTTTSWVSTPIILVV